MMRQSATTNPETAGTDRARFARVVLLAGTAAAALVSVAPAASADEIRIVCTVDQLRPGAQCDGSFLPNIVVESGRDLLGIQLSGAELGGAQLPGVIFGDGVRSAAAPANLSHTQLMNADLSLAHLVGVNLEGTKLVKTVLTGADLSKANLTKANLGEADLRYADLRGADLRGADVTGTVWGNADLTGATWVDGLTCGEGSVGMCSRPFTGLMWPEGAAVDLDGNVYVADRRHNRVVRYGPDGGSPTVILDRGLDLPDGVAVDDAKNVYIADRGNRRVVEVNARGELAIATDLTGVSSVAVDASGANVYVATSNGVLKIDRKTGTRTSVGRTGAQVQAVAVDKSGNVYIAQNDWNPAPSDEVYKVTPNNDQETVFHGTVWGLAVDTGGTVSTTRYNELTTAIPKADGGYTVNKSWGPFELSNGIAVGKHGRYITDYRANRVYYLPFQ
ncbi:pentapeptide repeat-containing protein [Rhodococcus erythropolis]|uniref:pentapeptide repeat-containing protein n=1 Tax=Rhodococcus erythropolis TaxID=1833 RepID=UPI00294A8F87|nr:pentapeptide repeat-containing protein [Rhodococcus erythropolis]MDV6278060.1 pentapeptide repeat-containing protein [Rhodococcus erythropolis]